jgi:leucyl aminopeptidase (aminopeptidase T)
MPAPLPDEILKATLAVFMTQYSATAPLDGLTRLRKDFRAASMPGVEKRMEDTALSADYREVARRCGILAQALDGADSLDVRFSTGHSCGFDLRFRRPEVDDGALPRFKAGERVINLPSGETYIVPYEGERADTPSRTSGVLPVRVGAELILLHVSANRILDVEGEGLETERLRAGFAVDQARRNIAEVAFGCNDRAVVTGNVLEDEKAGFHWAFGRSDHLGGTVGVDAFSRRDHVVHQDIVYARGNPVQVAEAVVQRGKVATTIIRGGDYIVF